MGLAPMEKSHRKEHIIINSQHMPFAITTSKLIIIYFGSFAAAPSKPGLLAAFTICSQFLQLR